MQRLLLYCIYFLNPLFSALCNQTIDTLYTGIFSGRVVPHAVVVPSRIDGDGQHVSFLMQNFHEPGQQNQRLFYQLTVKDDNLTVVLEPSLHFVSPYLAIQRRRNNQITRTHINQLTRLHKTGDEGGTARRKREVFRKVADKNKNLAGHCHYQGHVLGHTKSKVALSLCDGMVGLIRTQKYGEFWVEPIKEADSSSNQRLHVVFRRSSTKSDHSKKKKKKRKRKHEKNCGTRQPRRQTETQVEWKQQLGKVKVKGRGRSRKGRTKRSVSSERHVEALVVADMSMMRFHEDGYMVENYILTIMNMVSSLYQDPSIGNLVNIVVVNIILLEDDADQEGLNVTVNADQTLESFCKWQALQNYGADDHPNHHDVAILITREDICARQDTPCGTLGVAHVGGMCQHDRSCNVNEDNGITLAHTIAHELGHNFGMYHDTEKVGCSRKEGKTQHVMTPSFEADTVQVAWSSCSRRDITNFLDKGLGKCLEDSPIGHNFSYPELPPGAMYDAEYQCELQFGSKGAQVCSPLSEICHRLWCVVDSLCTTMLKPAAPGTSCGKHMWCQNQQCVPMGDNPDPIDGGWSDWGEWSECSRTCGAGVTTQERSCNHPVPVHGGKFCTGERTRHKICNIQACEDSTPFRAVQCASFNDQAFQGTTYKWVPYFDNADPCELYCADVNDTVIVPWGNAALDGTPCRVGSRDMCIKGICKRVGCDWVIDSAAQEDSCGVCYGSGDQCDTFSGVYDKEQGSGYEVVASIPSGARNIHIEETAPSKNFIGIGSEKTNNFFLNGRLEITISGEYIIGGTPGLYERDNEQERVHIPGPIREGVIVYVIYRGQYKNPGVAYNYTVSKVTVKTEQQYEWSFSEWSVCSATCGTGVQKAQPACRETNTAVVVHSGHCPQPQPDSKMTVCNTHSCPTRWWTGPWQLCTATCGDPQLTLRRRTVLCVEQSEQETAKVMSMPSIRPTGGIEYIEASNRRYTGQELALPDADCEGQEKPVEYESCPNLPPCVEPLITSEQTPRLDNDFTDYKLGFDELSQNYPKEKFERKALAPKKVATKKNAKRKRKKDRPKKIRHDEIEQLGVIFRKEAGYKHSRMRSHALQNMRYNSRHSVLL